MLSEEQVAHVLEPLLIARKQRPPMAQVYGLIAETWSLAARGPTREEFAVVMEGAQTFPGNGSLIWRTTLLAAQRNFNKEALLLAQHGMKISRDPADRSRFEMVAHAVERDAAAAASGPVPPPAVLPETIPASTPKLP